MEKYKSKPHKTFLSKNNKNGEAKYYLSMIFSTAGKLFMAVVLNGRADQHGIDAKYPRYRRGRVFFGGYFLKAGGGGL